MLFDRFLMDNSICELNESGFVKCLHSMNTKTPLDCFAIIDLVTFSHRE